MIAELKESMARASEELRFEDAAELRDRIAILESTKRSQPLVTQGSESRDVFGIYREDQLAALSIFVMRNGRIVDSINFSFQNLAIGDESLLESALTQFYDGEREIPDEIALPVLPENLAIVEKVLRDRRGGRIEIAAPQRGIAARLVGLAEVNAREHFVSVFNAEKRYLELCKGLALLLGLKQMPRKIECIDISNFQGSDIVGASVAFFDGEPDKKSYRHYKISRQGKPDDFAAVGEVVERRLRRGFESGDTPDLLIIDGGPGQLGAAVDARERLRLSIEIVSLAKMRTESAMQKQTIDKKPERVYVEGKSEPIELDEASAVTQFLQRIRDEAHRFVIGSHRRTRSKRVFKSVLDDIPGVGPERKRRLLMAYGSIEKMRGATATEFAKMGRMPLPLAQKILRIIGAQKG